MTTSSDHRFMSRALELARRGWGETNPNPAVGCLIVKNDRVLGEGFHPRAGAPHAEVFALAQAGTRARGATLYVTLEPCSHQGRTPPCAPLVRDSGASRVVVAMRDPNPLVSGRGLRLLRSAGIATEVGVGETEARRLVEPFAGAARLSRPFVVLKSAMTLDGRIATAGGESKWITSGAQRLEARRLRRACDGLLIGIGTALADDPLLLPRPLTRRPFHRVVLDSRLRLPTDSRLVRSAKRHPVWVVCCSDQPEARRELETRGVRILKVASGPEGRVDLTSALVALRDAGLTSLTVEGGGEVLGSAVRSGLFDKLMLYRAPLLLGGRGSRPAFGGEDPTSLSQAVSLRRGEATPGALHEVWYPAGRGRGNRSHRS